MQLAPGTLVLDGRFKVLHFLEKGGMGEIYLGEQVALGRKVALKLLRPDVASMEKMGERFAREARLLSSVDHPSVVRIIDFGETSGRACMAMEYVEGEPLDVALRQGPLLPDRAIRILVDLAEGLCAIHDKGIIHRDLNPQNVLLTQHPSGEHAKLLDFGVARLSETPPGAALTSAGLILGKPEYLSPEQARGAELTFQSDIYAFGVLAYQILSGELPFPGPEPLDYLRQHMGSAAPKALDQAAPHLADQTRLTTLVMRCLRKIPGERPPSARDLLERLKALPEVGDPTLFSETVISREAVLPSAERKKRHLPVRQIIAGAIAVSMFALIVVVAAGEQSPKLRHVRGLLEEKKTKEAFAALDTVQTDLTRDRDKQGAVLLRAVALHQQNRHKEELSLYPSPQNMEHAQQMILNEPLVLGAIVEDFGRTREGAPWKNVLVRLPKEALDERLEELLNDEGLTLLRWGALRYLDLSQRLDKSLLVQHYVEFLDSASCPMKGVAAQRLGELGDASAEEPLRKLQKAAPSSEDKGCGREEASAALKTLRKSGARSN